MNIGIKSPSVVNRLNVSEGASAAADTKKSDVIICDPFFLQ